MRERAKADYNPNRFWINQVKQFRGIYNAFGRPVVTTGAGRSGTRYAMFLQALEKSVQEGDNLWSGDFATKLKKSWYGLELKLCQVPEGIFKSFLQFYEKLTAGTLKVYYLTCFLNDFTSCCCMFCIIINLLFFPCRG